MKKVTIRELKAAESGLIKICNFEYPAKLAVKLTDFLESVIPIYQEFEDFHRDISMSLGEKKNKDTVDIKGKNKKEYDKQVKKLLDKEVQIEEVMFSDLEPHLNEDTRLTPAEVRSLKPILNFGK